MTQSSLGNQDIKDRIENDPWTPKECLLCNNPGLKSLEITNLRDLQFTEDKEKRWMFKTMSGIKLGP
jgi:hypothetical protein